MQDNPLWNWWALAIPDWAMSQPTNISILLRLISIIANRHTVSVAVLHLAHGLLASLRH
jgi:hypothetical protein